MTQSIEKAGSELVLFAPHLKVAMQMVQPLIPCFVGLQLRAICGQLHNMRRCGVSHSPQIEAMEQIWIFTRVMVARNSPHP